jgi:hypothetical protein
MQLLSMLLAYNYEYAHVCEGPMTLETDRKLSGGFAVITTAVNGAAEAVITASMSNC